MKIALTGMSGTGKTTLLESLKEKNIVRLPEVARSYLEQSNMFQEGGYELNIQSICVANWHNIAIMNSNPTLDFIVDRNIIDDLALMHLYFNKEIDLEAVQNNINKLNKENNTTHLYDTLFVIKNNTDRDFVENHILSDEQRKNSKDYDKHIANAVKFYKLVDSFLSRLEGVAANIVYKDFAELTSSDIVG